MKKKADHFFVFYTGFEAYEKMCILRSKNKDLYISNGTAVTADTGWAAQ